jgi:MFS family permease
MIHQMTIDDQGHALERSARLYPIYVFFQKASYWGPIFFLYFSSVLTLSDVLLLEAIYYISVVLLEIPTGYLSDRIGPRRVLIASSVAQMAACAAFASTGLFPILVCGQILLALGMSLGSGSDTSYHYAVLKGSDRVQEYGEREARSARALLLSQAISALLGGAAAVLDLRLAYLLTLASSGVAAWIAFQFAEIGPNGVEREDLTHQIRSCLQDAANPRLAWLLSYFIFITVINHIPHEFYQPFLSSLIHEMQFGLTPPAVTGFHTAVTLGIATVAATYSIRIRDRLGTSLTLLLAGLLQTAIIAAMALAQSPAIAVLIVFRSVPRGLMQAPLNAEVVPLLGENRRATYLSIQSLLGRLAFGAILLVFSRTLSGNEIVGPLVVSMTGAAIVLLLLTIAAPFSRKLRM